MSKSADTSPTASTGRTSFERLERATDLPLAFLAILIVPALVIEERAASPWLRQAAVAINWIVWFAFCAEYVGKLILSSDRRTFVRSAWFDLLLIVLSPPFLVPTAWQGARAVRVLRLLRFVRAAAVAAIGLREAAQGLRHRHFHYITIVTIVIVVVGAMGVYAVEGGENANIHSLGDALWWSIVTATTVGYGDVSPVTTEGRFIAVALMLVGIGFIGVFTATITSFFVLPTQEKSDFDERLTRIETKLDALMADRQTAAGQTIRES